MLHQMIKMFKFKWTLSGKDFDKVEKQILYDETEAVRMHNVNISILTNLIWFYYLCSVVKYENLYRTCVGRIS